MDAKFLSDKFAAALPYDKYLATGTDEQQRRWKQSYDAARVTDVQRATLSGFVREMNLLVVSGIWCGDCVQQCTLIARLAEANAAKVHLRLIDRDAHKDLSSQCRINAGDRVPVTLFLAEDFECLGTYGDRTLHRYRAIARNKLGAACPTGLGPPDADEAAATMQDWMNEIERFQLMLRLSPRLRTKHGD